MVVSKFLFLLFHETHALATCQDTIGTCVSFDLQVSRIRVFAPHFVRHLYGFLGYKYRCLPHVKTTFELGIVMLPNFCHTTLLGHQRLEHQL